MNITGKELLDENLFISHAVLNAIGEIKGSSGIIDSKIEEYKAKMGCEPFSYANVEYDVKLFFEGHELDVRQFFNLLQKEYYSELKKTAKEEIEKGAKEMFEKFKHEYKSKNSANAKLEKIRKQMEKCSLELQNITNGVNNLKIGE